MALCALAVIVAAFLGRLWGLEGPVTDVSGFLFTVKGSPLGHNLVSTIVNVLCLLVTGGILLALNRVYVYVRSETHLMAAAFFLLALSYPSGLVTFNMGTVLCLLAALATMPLFAAYQDRHSQRSIFLITALMAAGSLFDYGFLMLLPAFLLGFINMGIMNLKGVLAMLFGLVTPFWIVLGLGIASPADMALPQWHGIWTLSRQELLRPIVAIALFIAALGGTLAVMNMLTIMNYRMQTRVCNAYFVYLLTMVIVAMAIDWSHLDTYLPLLNLMVAVQVAQSHTLRAPHPHRYIFLLLLIAACLAGCAANMMLP